MAGGLGTMLREQPILAGCLGILAIGTLVLCGGGALLVLGGKALVDKASESAGVDGVISTAQAADAAGFMFNVAIDEGGTVYTLAPMEPRTVTCDDVQAVLFPHLTGTLETVVVQSQSILLNDDGSYTTVPLTCTWGGWPGKDGGAGVLKGGLGAVPDELPLGRPVDAAPSEGDTDQGAEATPSDPAVESDAAEADDPSLPPEAPASD